MSTSADPQGEHLGAAQPGEQHQPGDRLVPPGPQARQERGHLDPVQSARQPPRLPRPHRRPRLWARQMPQQAVPLRPGRPTHRGACRHRVHHRGITHRPEREQSTDRSQSPIHRRRRQSITATSRQEPQQHIGVHRLQSQLLLGQPPGERQQIERVGPPGPRRVVPVGEIAEVVVAPAADPRRRRTGQHPAVITRSTRSPHRHSHETRIPPTAQPEANTAGPRRVAAPSQAGLAGKRRHHLHLLGGRRARRTRRPASPEPEADDGAGKPVEQGARRFGKSKDHRDDLPQVVIAMAVTRDGIPVRCWTFPGSESDQRIIRTVKDDLGSWQPAPAGVGRRRRLRLRRQPRLPHPRRRALHPRREAAPHQRRGRRRAGPPRPLPRRGRQPAGQGGPGGTRRRHRRRGARRAVRGVPQPRRRRP